jgi:hypothetical protein
MYPGYNSSLVWVVFSTSLSLIAVTFPLTSSVSYLTKQLAALANQKQLFAAGMTADVVCCDSVI